MMRIGAPLVILFASTLFHASDEKMAPNPSFNYEVAKAHEVKPHRRTIPTHGVHAGVNQLRLTLTVSPTGWSGPRI